MCLIIRVADWTLSCAVKQQIGKGYDYKEPNEMKSSAGEINKRGEKFCCKTGEFL